MDKRTTFILLAAATVLVATGRYVTAGDRDSSAGPLRQWPDPQRLDTLSAFLHAPQGTGPIIPETALRTEDFVDYEPAYEPIEAPADAEPAPSWRVSAILVADNRRVAIVNDSAVSIGDTVPGGARVVEIELDFVVLRAADGARTVLRL